MDNKIMESLDSISKGVSGLNSRIDSMDSRLTNLEKGVQVKPASDETYQALQKRFDELEAKQKSVVIMTPENLEKSKMDAKTKYFRTLFKALVNKDNDTLKGLEEMSKASNTYHYNTTVDGSAGAMGYYIPEEWSSNIVDLTVNYQNMNSVLPYVNMIPMNRTVMNLGEKLGNLTAGYIAAGSAITDSTTSAGNTALTAKKIACLANYDNEVLADVNPNILRMIEGDARNAFAYRMNYTVLSGSGATDYNNVGITGVLSASDTNVVTMASSAYNTIDTQDLADMIDAITVDINQGVFVFPKTLRGTIMNLTDAGGLIWRPSATNYGPETIWGFPVIWVNGILPATSAITADKKFGIFGDFTKGAYWGDRMSLEVAVDSSLRFDTYQTTIRWVRRGDAKIFGKCFSVLKTKA